MRTLKSILVSTTIPRREAFGQFFGYFSIRYAHWEDVVREFRVPTWRTVLPTVLSRIRQARSWGQIIIVRLMFNGGKTPAGVPYRSVGGRMLLDIDTPEARDFRKRELQAFNALVGDEIDLIELGFGYLDENNAGTASSLPFSAESMRMVYEDMYEIFGTKISLCIGGSLGGYHHNGQWIPPTNLALFLNMFKDGGPLADKRCYWIFQDNYNDDKGYRRLARDYMGYDPDGVTCETSGNANELENPEGAFQEFADEEYTAYRNMGSPLHYPDAENPTVEEFLVDALPAAQALVERFLARQGETPPNPNPDPDMNEIKIEVVGGTIASVVSVPEETHDIPDGASEYTVNTKVPVEDGVRVNVSADTNDGFVSWVVVPESSASNPPDEDLLLPEGSVHTRGRGADIAIEAVMDGGGETPGEEYVTREEFRLLEAEVKTNSHLIKATRSVTLAIRSWLRQNIFGYANYDPKKDQEV